ncbi:hypothetical protein GOODEAATRI_002934 [Goodea atripinnis]|uniref:TRASH domain-containing protein n=1 Tax=Goodea atripinnis TaxID=208336 RepID=A0ABV0MEM2_9TELE
MDGESEPNPVVAEEAKEKAELLVATPSSQQPSPPPAEESGEPVSMETGDEATNEGGTEDNDDDVVLVEEEASQPPPAAASSPDEPNAESAEQPAVEAADAAAEDTAAMPSKSPDSPPSSDASMVAASQKPPTTAPEPIVIDDEEDCEQKETSSLSPVPPGDSSASHSPGALSNNDPDSEIKISSVTTLGSSNQKSSAVSAVNTPPDSDDAQADINLMITSVTSLQGGAAAVLETHGSLSRPQFPATKSKQGWTLHRLPPHCPSLQASLPPPLPPQAPRHYPGPSRDITHIKGTIVAQVDSSESFQEFCTTGCLGAYENKNNPPKTGLKNKCTVCGKLTEVTWWRLSPVHRKHFALSGPETIGLIRHEVSFKNVTHKICSDTCFNVYRKANGLIMNCCEQCGDYLPSRASANHFLLVDGQQKRFCCQNCIRDYKQAHSKLACCMTCKTLIKTGEVLQRY